MLRRKFQTQRPQAIAERGEQIRRLQQLRRMLAETDSCFAAFASDLYAEDGDYDRVLRRAVH